MSQHRQIKIGHTFDDVIILSIALSLSITTARDPSNTPRINWQYSREQKKDLVSCGGVWVRGRVSARAVEMDVEIKLVRKGAD